MKRRTRSSAPTGLRRSTSSADASPLEPTDAPAVLLSQIRAALQRRREHRREAVSELRTTLAALADSVGRHTARVDDVRRAVEAQGGDLAPLQFYDSMMARFRMELRAAERTLADVFRVAAEESSARL